MYIIYSPCIKLTMTSMTDRVIKQSSGTAVHKQVSQLLLSVPAHGIDNRSEL